MALERMQVTNHERWGNLVKTWSTGKNYLDDDNEYPIPRYSRQLLLRPDAPPTPSAKGPF